jgi:hypothetical protein
MKSLFLLFVILFSLNLYAKDGFDKWKTVIQKEIKTEMKADDVAFSKSFSLKKMNNIKYYIHENSKNINQLLMLNESLDNSILDHLILQLQEFDTEVKKITKQKETYFFIKLRTAYIVLSKHPYNHTLDALSLTNNSKEKYEELLSKSQDFLAMNFINDLFLSPKKSFIESDNSFFPENDPLIETVCELIKQNPNSKHKIKLEQLCGSIKSIAKKHSENILDILENYNDAYPSEENLILLFNKFLLLHPFPVKKDNLEGDVQYINVPT